MEEEIVRLVREVTAMCDLPAPDGKDRILVARLPAMKHLMEAENRAFLLRLVHACAPGRVVTLHMDTGLDLLTVHVLLEAGPGAGAETPRTARLSSADGSSSQGQGACLDSREG